MLGIETVSENITEGEIRHIQREGNVHGKKKNQYKYSDGVISPSCGLFCILLLKMLRGCIFTTVGISKNKI